MVVYYCISLLHWLQLRLQSYIFLSMSILNRRSPFNGLRNELNAFLVTIPDSPAGSSFSLRHRDRLAIAIASPSPRLAPTRFRF